MVAAAGGTACAYAARYLSVAVRYSLTITGTTEAAGACGLWLTVGGQPTPGVTR